MSEYIDKLSATSIPVVPKEHRKQFANYDDAFETGWNEALAYVNDIQPADVVSRESYESMERTVNLLNKALQKSVEVVRCKDCRWWDSEEHNCVIRDSYGWDYKPTDFCSYGENAEAQEESEIINARRGEE